MSIGGLGRAPGGFHHRRPRGAPANLPQGHRGPKEISQAAAQAHA